MYIIEVLNEQVIDGEKGSVTEKASGNYTLKNGKAYIRYQTSNEGDNTLTTVIAENDTVTIKRSGAVSSSMIFKKNIKTSFLYHLPYGSIPMEIDTEIIENSLSENGGTLIIRYSLIAQGEKYGNNITIQVTEGDMREI